MNELIELSRLGKCFGSLVAVADLNFTVRRGEVVGLLGPNGAGKTTAMRMVCGFLTPSVGTAIVCGVDVTRQPVAARRGIGYLPEGAPAWSEMTPDAFLGTIARIRGFSGAEATRRIALSVERACLGDVLHQPIETLSRGYKRRVGLAQALLHDPEVLILDEPTEGLDPNQKRDVRALIAELAPAKAIIISTHLLDDVEMACTRALIIGHGRLLADGSPAELRARSRLHNAVRLVLSPDHAAAARAALLALPRVRAVESRDDAQGHALLVLPRDDAPILTDIVDLIRGQGWTLLDIRVEAGRLDEVFHDLTMGAASAGRDAAMPAPG